MKPSHQSKFDETVNRCQEIEAVLVEIMRFEASMRILMSRGLITPCNFLNVLDKAAELIRK